MCEISPHRTAQYRRRGRTQDKPAQADALAIARSPPAERVGLPRVQRDDLSPEQTRLINQFHCQMLQLDPV